MVDETSTSQYWTSKKSWLLIVRQSWFGGEGNEKKDLNDPKVRLIPLGWPGGDLEGANMINLKKSPSVDKKILIYGSIRINFWEY